MLHIMSYNMQQNTTIKPKLKQRKSGLQQQKQVMQIKLITTHEA